MVKTEWKYKVLGLGEKWKRLLHLVINHLIASMPKCLKLSSVQWIFIEEKIAWITHEQICRQSLCCYLGHEKIPIPFCHIVFYEYYSYLGIL